MSSILSVYYSPTHWYPQDEDYIRRLDPAWVRIHQPTARAIEQVQRVAPNTKIMLRSWDIDDYNGDRKREMYADPKGAAVKHLNMWGDKLDELEAELKRNGWTYDKTKWCMGLVNEPDPAYVAQVVIYTDRAIALANELGWHLGVICSSVGTFKKPNEGDDGWTACKPLEKPINDGGHILIAHEYWQPEGPNYGEDGGNLAWRHHSIPLNVPVLIGESGANGYIYGRYSKNDDSGWQKTVADPKPETFARQVKEYIEGCDQRVQGVCLYMLDFHSDQWWSFNTGPAMEQLLAIKDARPRFVIYHGDEPVTVHLPSVGNGPTPAEEPKSMATGIIDPRVAQAILKIESGGRTHGSDGKIIIRFEAHIFKTYLKNDALWVQHFSVDPAKPWTNQQWRRDAGSPVWAQLHTGNQADEWAAFNFARSLNTEAACNSISMGAAQIMGFNHARVGYPSAQAMFESFQNAPMQTIGFINYCLSDAGLIDAIRRKDWRTIAAKYNGTGQVDYYAGLLENAYKGG